MTAILIPLVIFLAALLITAALSPIETLSWWAGWTEEEIEQPQNPPTLAPAPNGRAKIYVIYLSGISSISGQYLIPREKTFIKSLREALPHSVVIDDVFPYSPAGLHMLAAARLFDRLWRKIQSLKLEGRGGFVSGLIKIRNVFQVMISADHRYGPIFNQGAAHVMESALLRAGYRPHSNARIAVIGYSGGAQIAIGTATFLKARLGTSIEVVSIGGVMASDPGLRFVRQLHHLIGDGDNIRKSGAIMFPERWAIMGHSEWNIAKHEGRVVIHRLKGMVHAGPRGYFGLPLVNGISNNQRTVATVKTVLSLDQNPPALDHD